MSGETAQGSLEIGDHTIEVRDVKVRLRPSLMWSEVSFVWPSLGLIIIEERQRRLESIGLAEAEVTAILSRSRGEPVPDWALEQLALSTACLVGKALGRRSI